MLTVTHPAPNRIDMELTAVLDGDMMAAALDELVEKSQAITDGVMMYHIRSFSLPTGGAMVAEMMRLPQLFDLIGHFKRCAVVTDISWIRTAAEIEGRMITGLDIRAFETRDEAAAEAWLASVDQAPVEDEDEDDFADNMPV